jgi:hypothetical protein
MNILKLAKNLKAFTLDEIEILTECACSTELDELIFQGNIQKVGGFYHYITKQVHNVDIFEVSIVKDIRKNDIDFNQAVMVFLNKYAAQNCSPRTYLWYHGAFKNNICPFFENRKIGSIMVKDVKNFKEKCTERKLSSGNIKNNLALLNQFIRYFQNNGYIDKTCIFQVKRIEDKRKELRIFDEEILTKFLKLTQKYHPNTSIEKLSIMLGDYSFDATMEKYRRYIL